MPDYRNNGETASWSTKQVRQAQNKQQEPRRSYSRKKRFRGGRTLIKFVGWVVFVAVASVLLADIGWLLASDLCAFNKDYMEATVTVTKTDTMDTVTDKLADAGLIKYKWFFKLFSKFAKAEEKIGIGTYELNTDMDYRALIVGMHNASGNMNAETVTITIPEGYTMAQIFHLMEEKGVSTEEKLMEAAKGSNFEYAFIDNKSKDPIRLEGYLFPDTYEFYLNHNAKSAISKLIDTFDRNIDDELLEAAKARGYDLKKIVIIASLIEKETDGTDQRKIASVIYNRLANPGKTGGLLQIDASVLYGLPGHTGAITAADLATDTPYNLYMHKGLPPTPIANPGAAALEAAMDPETTNYYYYALGKDGKHHYFENYDQHHAFVTSDQYGG